MYTSMVKRVLTFCYCYVLRTDKTYKKRSILMYDDQGQQVLKENKNYKILFLKDNMQ